MSFLQEIQEFVKTSEDTKSEREAIEIDEKVSGLKYMIRKEAKKGIRQYIWRSCTSSNQVMIEVSKRLEKEGIKVQPIYDYDDLDGYIFSWY